MAMKEYRDADGNIVRVDDTITALGPNPDLSRCTKQEKFPGASFHKMHLRDGAPQPPSGYGVTDADMDAWKRELQRWFEIQRSRRRKL